MLKVEVTRMRMHVAARFRVTGSVLNDTIEGEMLGRGPSTSSIRQCVSLRLGPSAVKFRSLPTGGRFLEKRSCHSVGQPTVGRRSVSVTCSELRLIGGDTPVLQHTVEHTERVTPDSASHHHHLTKASPATLSSDRSLT
jgi:hypothetical protein